MTLNGYSRKIRFLH